MKTKEELTAEVVELTKKVDELRATVDTMNTKGAAYVDPMDYYEAKAHLRYYEQMLRKASVALNSVCIKDLKAADSKMSPAAIFCLVILGGFILACILASIGN